jgi:predicted nucleotidyltransferase
MRDRTAVFGSAASGALAVPESLRAEIRSALQGLSEAVMLYGSRARGTSRPDSDVDVMQLVAENPRSYSKGRVNVAAYTPDHLSLLAQRGSLFVAHLRQEGITLFDPKFSLQNCLNQYRPPSNYDLTKRELALIFAAGKTIDAPEYAPSLLRAVVYGVRTALYIKTAELDQLTFQTDRACEIYGDPGLYQLLNASVADGQSIATLADFGSRIIGMRAPKDTPRDIPSMVIWSWNSFSLASRLLEAVVAGSASIDYTSLTIPLA